MISKAGQLHRGPTHEQELTPPIAWHLHRDVINIQSMTKFVPVQRRGTARGTRSLYTQVIRFKQTSHHRSMPSWEKHQQSHTSALVKGRGSGRAAWTRAAACSAQRQWAQKFRVVDRILCTRHVLDGCAFYDGCCKGGSVSNTPRTSRALLARSRHDGTVRCLLHRLM